MSNELYAGVFQKTYGVETLGLRYFNVFGHRQDPEWYIKNINEGIK